MEDVKSTHNRMVVIGLTDEVRRFMRRAGSDAADLDLAKLWPIPYSPPRDDANLDDYTKNVQKWCFEHWGNLGLTDVTSDTTQNDVTMAVTYRFNIAEDHAGYCPNLEWFMNLAKEFPNLRFDLFATRDEFVWTAACSGEYRERIYRSRL